jgi:transposase
LELPPVPAESSVGQLWALVCELRGDNAALREVIEAQSAPIAALERELGKDSSTSSRPPSSDSPYRKPVRRSSRKSSGRAPGKQPGGPGRTRELVDSPDELITCDPGCCGGCGADLSGAPVVGVQRRQVVEVVAPPAPRVTEYRIVTRVCTACGRTATGPVSVGVVASVRGRAARVLEQTFLPRVRQLLGQVGVLHVDETPARAASGLRYVHVAATDYLTALHTGGRSKAHIDAR